MGRKIVHLLLLFALILLVGCSNNKTQTVHLDLEIPEALAVNTPEILKQIDELRQQAAELKGKNSSSKEKEEKLNEQAARLLESRIIIDDKELINKIFAEINNLKAEVVTGDGNYKPSEDMLFSFDLIDDKEKGLEGNNYDKDLRYLMVLQDQSIVVPMLSEDGKSAYFAKARIDSELFGELKAIGGYIKQVNQERQATNESAETKISENDAKPLLYFKSNAIASNKPLTSAKEPIIIEVESNLELRRESVEIAINNTITSNDPARKTFDYQIQWQSDRRFDILFKEINDSEVIYFRLDGVLNHLGKSLLNDDQPGRNTVVFEKKLSSDPKIIFTDVSTKQHQELQIQPGYRVQQIDLSQSSDNYVLVYGKQKHLLVNLNEQKRVKTIPILKSTEPKEFEKFIGYQEEMYSDRFHGDFTYMVKANADLYRVNLKDSAFQKLYHSDKKPIYNVSSSPDGQKAAILISNTDYAQSPEADLLILDRQGEKIFQLEKASFLSKSDGIYGIYPLTWKDNNTIVVEREIFDEKRENLGPGIREVDINSGKFKDQLNGSDIEATVMKDILEKYNARKWDLHPLWSPDRSKLAYNTYFNTLWVYDVENKQYYLVGTGTFVKWLDDRQLVWYKDLYSGL